MARRSFKKVIYALIVLSVSAFSPFGGASAQNCSVAYEAIVKLREPDLGAYNIWSGIHGDEDKQETYIAGAVLPNRFVLLAGEVREKDGDTPKIVMSEVDRRGRIVWEKFHDIPQLEGIVKMIPYQDGYVILGNKKDAKGANSVWIGFFDEKGEMKSQRVHGHGGSGSLYAYDMIPKAKGGFLMAVAVKANVKDAAGFSSFYRLNEKAQFIDKRSYLFGHDNRLFGLAELEDGSVMAAGYMSEGADGRRQGWLLKLEGDGKIMWQRQYPRGAHAELQMVQGYGKNSLLAVGSALPAGEDDKHKAGWVMVLDHNSGNVMWQRYFTGAYNYVSRDMLVNDDGLISVMMDAEPVLKKEDAPQEDGETPKDFVRLITLNPRGVMFESQEHFNGEGADAYTMIEGPNKERIVIGGTDMAYTIENSEAPPEAEPQVKHSREAWVIAAPAPSPYDDPCI